jgi:sugar O-acyltransferase (sialic acid O-acetyltransferase NeuD family)
MKPLIIFGAGGHAKEVIEAARASGMAVSAALDDHPTSDAILGVPIIRSSEIAREDLRLYRFVVAIGNCAVRREKFEALRDAGATPETVIHPRAYVSVSATIGRGAVILAMATVQASVAVGENSIVNVAALIGHDCRIGNHCHVSGGVSLGGSCVINDEAWVSLGASVKEGVIIGEGAFIGMGAMISRHVPAHHKAISPHRKEAAILAI